MFPHTPHVEMVCLLVRVFSKSGPPLLRLRSRLIAEHRMAVEGMKMEHASIQREKMDGKEKQKELVKREKVDIED